MKAPVRGLTTMIDTKGLVCHAMLSRNVVRELLKITCNILLHQKSKKHRAEKVLGNLIVCKFSMTRVALSLKLGGTFKQPSVLVTHTDMVINSIEHHGYKV